VCHWCDRKLLKIVENMVSGLKEGWGKFSSKINTIMLSFAS
jgi:hypothetical protein